MFDLDGADPEPEASPPNPKELDAFRSEAARFQQRRKTQGDKKEGGRVVILLIAAVLLFGFILAVLWAACSPTAFVRPCPRSARPIARA
jgi:hypothetical protein